MTPVSAQADADLHAFVDGLLEPDRRDGFLRRLAASSDDRDRVDSWQQQNDLIRSAFAGVTREALPAALDLVPPIRLHPDPIEAVAIKPSRTGRVAVAVATMLLVAACVGGTWMLSATDENGQTNVADTPLRGTIDATLANRATRALAGDVRTRPDRTDALPIAAIPDLGPSGFTLTRAETEVGQPASLMLHYENADADRLVLSVARAGGGGMTAPTRVGRGYSWRRHDKAFALAGTVNPERLLDIALSLEDDAAEN